MINTPRKIQLVNACRIIFVNLDPNIKGNKSMAQLALNRIEQFAKTSDEYQYMIDTIVVMVKQIGKDPEVAKLKIIKNN